MLKNNYLDTNIQKAFVNGIPGCAEHQLKLASAIKEAHKKPLPDRLLARPCKCVGSVHHELIDFSLSHYQAQDMLINTITSIYTNLSAEVTSSDWSTGRIPLEVGVYQGDPLSTVIFNTVMCTLIEPLRPHYHLGYTFSNSKHSLHLLQYADDACLISDGPASCQELIRQVEKWLQWTGMKAKPIKCHSLGIRASSGTPFDPALTIRGQSIPYINN